MRRRAAKPSAATNVTVQASALAMVLVDGRQIRHELKEEYEKVVRDLARARAELDRFQQQDTPGFTRWVHSQFGALLTELRETSHKLRQCDERLAEMEAEVIFLGVSPGRAYQRVMRRHQEADDEGQHAAENNEPSNHERHERQSEYNGEYWDAEDRLPPGRRKRRKPVNLGGRLKEIYRALVRRLHPDKQKEMTGQRLEWWHQAQEAYQKGDEEQLEVILTLCEIEETGHVEKASISVLQRITKQFKKTLRQIRRQLGQARKEPAWRFSTRKDVAALASAMKEQLTRELEGMRRELYMLEEQLGAWARQAQRTRRPVYRRRRVVDPFF